MFDRYDELDEEKDFGLPPLGSARQRAPGSNRRLALIATAIGVALLAVGGGLELASHRSTVVPVLVADSRPIRVRPENPGGMQVIGANENLAADSTTGAETLTPPPEAPDTFALHARQQADETAHAPAWTGGPMPQAASLSRPGDAAPDVPLPPQISATLQEAPPAAAPADPAKPAPVTRAQPSARAQPPASAPPSSTSPTQATPAAVRPAMPAIAAPAAAPAVRTIAPTPAHVAAAAPPPQASAASPATAPTTSLATSLATTGGSGGKVVQLAAVSSEEAATAEWDRLARRMPDLLGGRRPEIVKFEHDGHVFFRLRTAGFSDSATAAAFCERVRAKGANCAVF